MSGVDNNAAIAVDVSSGNIYISSGRKISVVSPSLNSLTIVDSTNIIANIGKIAVMPQSGSIAWYEGNTRIVIANMDGSNVRPITVQSMEKPEDIAFDLDDDRGLYWCDSVLDKIEKIDTQSLAITIVYVGRGLKPVAIEIFADVIYLVPMQQRKIVQINKINGLQQRDVFESPLLGSLDNFFISRKFVTGKIN
ncbi:sortilin-related receptor-like [Ruditapes philippinarum]|uniref:sortilin-related receptor-like n=1 Tax=Ruditapes philippinarum TaxID=129788 RepID=UPI00295A6426|nr:sortilin-related receptor-like [Ruditapes philippinarum]